MGRVIAVRCVIILVASFMSACASINPSSNNQILHSTIAQGGRQLSPDSAVDGMYKYSIAGGSFSILIPSADINGKKYDPTHAEIRICASTNPLDLHGVVTGANPQDTHCLNSMGGLRPSIDKVSKGIYLLVSNGRWKNEIFGFNDAGLTYNSLNIRSMLVFKNHQWCVFNSPGGCKIDRSNSAALPVGSKVYMAVFVDMNGNNVMDPGELTLMEIDIVPPKYAG